MKLKIDLMKKAYVLSFSHTIAVIVLAFLTFSCSDGDEEPSAEVSAISPVSGLVNTSVVITGTNFSSVLTENIVSFNGTAATVTAASATQLTTTVPSSAQTGPVIVTVKGKAVANQPTFTVNALPVLTTSKVTLLTLSTATGGGEVTSDGGATINFRGLCWSSKNQLPTIADSKSLDGTGMGKFTTSMTGLAESATYYVRAYATTSVGTAYGDVVVFTVHLVGQLFQGGILAYLLQPGDPGYMAGEAHGLVTQPEDSYSSKWHASVHGEIGASAQGTALGTGNANTIAIVNALGSGTYAAKVCYDLVLGGHDDWYLPSKDELNKLYLNKAILGGFNSQYYWTSTETGSSALIESFTTGLYSSYDKGALFGVRAIRTF